MAIFHHQHMTQELTRLVWLLTEAHSLLLANATSSNAVKPLSFNNESGQFVKIFSLRTEV